LGKANLPEHIIQDDPQGVSWLFVIEIRDPTFASEGGMTLQLVSQAFMTYEEASVNYNRNHETQFSLFWGGVILSRESLQAQLGRWLDTLFCQ
jgi:hypothetical protein